MKILIINGPNLNMLGIREKDIYGKDDYPSLCRFILENANDNVIEIFQSNFEGEIVEKIQSAYNNFDGIIINPAAYSHTSIAILDALKAVGLPTVEVHLSDIDSRENFRRFSYVSLYAEQVIKGKGKQGYIIALQYLTQKYGKNN